MGCHKNMTLSRKEQIKNQSPVTQEVIDTIIISREGLSEKLGPKWISSIETFINVVLQEPF
jgi:hypothetical protein